MKNKKAVYGILMFASLVGLGVAFYLITKKKGVVMQAQSPGILETDEDHKPFVGTGEAIKSIQPLLDLNLGFYESKSLVEPDAETSDKIYTTSEGLSFKVN